MVNYPTILNLPQKDINRQLYERVLKLQVKVKYHVLSLTVNDGTDPISGATVVIGETTKTTGTSGGCTFLDMPYDTYSATVSAEGYTSKTESIVFDATHKSFTISLSAAVSAGTVTVTCKDESENLLDGAEVMLFEGEVSNDPFAYGTTDSNGVTTLTLWDAETHQPTQDTGIAFGTYVLLAQYVDAQEDSYVYQNNLTVDGDENVTATLTLEE